MSNKNYYHDPDYNPSDSEIPPSREVIQRQAKEKDTGIDDLDLSEFFADAEENRDDETITSQTSDSSPHDESLIDLTSPNETNNDVIISFPTTELQSGMPPKLQDPASTSDEQISLTRAMMKDILTEVFQAAQVRTRPDDIELSMPKLTIEKLGLNNFATWKVQAQAVLTNAKVWIDPTGDSNAVIAAKMYANTRSQLIGSDAMSKAKISTSFVIVVKTLLKSGTPYKVTTNQQQWQH
jgi:hypothetical protein